MTGAEKEAKVWHDDIAGRKRRGELDAEIAESHVMRYIGLQIAEAIRKLDEQEGQDAKSE